MIEKRIEVPETFQAIQTYRATVTLLSHQKAFVKDMNAGANRSWGMEGGCKGAHVSWGMEREAPT